MLTFKHIIVESIGVLIFLDMYEQCNLLEHKRVLLPIELSS